MRKLLEFSGCAALLGLCAAQAAETVRYSQIAKATIEERLRATPHTDFSREEALKSLFEKAGCPAAQLIEQPVKHVKAPNVICTIPGETDSQIVIGAHFDFVNRGSGVIDNWSGASLLPSVLESLARFPRTKNRA